ncbi:MAG: MATE family efflux transporter [Bacillota bacterium]
METAVSLPQLPAPRSAVRKEILRIAWPVVAEQLLATMANMVDAALVGRLGAVATAAVGLTQMPHWLMVGLFMGLGVGVNALAARFHGAGEDHRLEATTRAGFWLAVATSLLAGGAIYSFAPAIFRLVGAEPDVLPVGVPFLRAMVPGMIAVFWSVVLSAALRATGDTRTPMVINLGANLLNAVLAYSFIYGHFGAPALGVMGAALATSSTRILAALVLFAVLLRRERGARLEWRRMLSLDLSLLWRILKVGAVSSTERMFSTVVYIGYARMVNTLGTVAVAAQYIAVQAENVSWMLASGFAMASAAMVGQRLGAGKPEEAEGVIKEAARMAMIALGVLAVLFIAIPRPYIALFTGDPDVLNMAAAALRVGGLAEVPTALVLVLNGALSGAGDTRPLFLVTLAGGIVRLSMTAVLILVMGLGLEAAWFAALADWLVRSAVIWWRFRTGIWKTIRV